MAVKSKKSAPLYFEPATEAENRRIGPDGTALIDYMLHPPQDAASRVGQDISDELRHNRRAALRALTKGAFGP